MVRLGGAAVGAVIKVVEYLRVGRAIRGEGEAGGGDRLGHGRIVRQRRHHAEA